MPEEGTVRAGRYEIHNASILDLIRTAYDIEAAAVLDGPSFLALDRFDVIAKPPERTPPATINLMLQSLLADRFNLVARKDTRALPAWVLSTGAGKLKLKPPDNSGDSGCRVFDNNQRVSCRHVTMDAFAAWLRAGRLTTLPVLNSTRIDGDWDFDFSYNVSGGMTGISENNPILDAIDKQLGLKLELQNTSQSVLIVESVDRQPTPNVAGIEKSLPPFEEFEVASIRPCRTFELFGGRVSAGGQVTTGCLSLGFHVMTAWDLCVEVQATPNQVVGLCGDNLAGAPKWMGSRYFNIVAKAPVPVRNPDVDATYHAMLRNLLRTRFKMAAHYEDRLVDAYTLVAAKPKLRKADPSSRTGCTSNGTLVGIPTVLTCRNVMMTQFAEQLNHHMPIVASGRRVVDASGIQGVWDLSLTYRVAAGANTNAPGVASDPAGGVSLFEALEQQLGLKLEKARRRLPVFVIDHIEENPTDN
jgi:uncharacterized protein (TIGR03435 family)